jgi:hypothetical protein
MSLYTLHETTAFAFRCCPTEPPTRLRWGRRSQWKIPTCWDDGIERMRGAARKRTLTARQRRSVVCKTNSNTQDAALQTRPTPHFNSKDDVNTKLSTLCNYHVSLLGGDIIKTIRFSARSLKENEIIAKFYMLSFRHCFHKYLSTVRVVRLQEAMALRIYALL